MCNSFWGHPAWREQQSLSASACLAARPSVCCIGAQESPQLDPCSEAPALLCRQNPCEQLLFAFLTWQDSRSQPIPSTASGSCASTSRAQFQRADGQCFGRGHGGFAEEEAGSKGSEEARCKGRRQPGRPAESGEHSQDPGGTGWIFRFVLKPLLPTVYYIDIFLLYTLYISSLLLPCACTGHGYRQGEASCFPQLARQGHAPGDLLQEHGIPDLWWHHVSPGQEQ